MCVCPTDMDRLNIMVAVWSLPWASYQIRKIAGCACAGNAGNVFPRRRFQRKPLVSDPGMHHGTCVTHVPWCMSGSLTCGDGENVPGIPGACASTILRIWQEAHGSCYVYRNKALTDSPVPVYHIAADFSTQLRKLLLRYTRKLTMAVTTPIAS